MHTIITTIVLLILFAIAVGNLFQVYQDIDTARRFGNNGKLKFWANTDRERAADMLHHLNRTRQIYTTIAAGLLVVLFIHLLKMLA